MGGKEKKRKAQKDPEGTLERHDGSMQVSEDKLRSHAQQLARPSSLESEDNTCKCMICLLLQPSSLLKLTPRSARRAFTTTVSEQGLLLTGAATLAVQSGAVEVQGASFTPDDAPAELIADPDVGGPLHITARPTCEQVRVPMVAGATTISLEPLSDAAGQPQVLQINELDDRQAPSQQPVPAIWRSAAQTITEVAGPSGRDLPLTLTVAVCGAKSVGKSSFLRLLANKLLNTHPCVAYLDTDCGQPEFTVPGVVSLVLLTKPIFGPPHLHHRKPHRCHFVGDMSPEMDPAQYVRAVRALYQWYCQEAGHTDANDESRDVWPPLVINTHGWIQGAGLDVLVNILQTTHPTHVITLQNVNPKRNLPEGRFWLQDAPTAAGTHLMVLPGITSAPLLSSPLPGASDPGSDRQLTAPELRGLAWLAFARRCLGQPDAGISVKGDPETYAAVATALAACPPYEVACAGIKIQVLHMSVPEEYLAHAINCTVVGLAASNGSPNGSEEGLDTAEAQPMECVGVGFVRSVDAAKGVVYVLTDVDTALLDRVDVLQVGRLEIPPALLQTKDLMSPYLSLWSVNAEGSGAGQIRSRNNLTRSGQL